jgi:hypothetical protein
MHILCSVHCARALNVGIGSEGLFDEILDALLALSVTLDCLEDNAMCRTPGLACKRCNAGFELRR